MNAAETVTVAYLTMSVLNLAWQSAALRRLTRGSSVRSRDTPFYRGLLRTSRCRVGVAVAHVGVGLNAIYPRAEVVLVTLGVFCVTHGVWMLNSWADLRLGRRLKAALHDGVNTDIPHPSGDRRRRLKAAFSRRRRSPPQREPPPGEPGAA